MCCFARNNCSLKQKPMSITRLGMLLSTAGFQAVRKQIGGIRLRGWAVYQHNSDEINAMRNLEIYR
jgi:hypothetical protein